MFRREHLGGNFEDKRYKTKMLQNMSEANEWKTKVHFATYIFNRLCFGKFFIAIFWSKDKVTKMVKFPFNFFYTSSKIKCILELCVHQLCYQPYSLQRHVLQVQKSIQVD